jgi:5-exo-hydroxycamphor dehydrogenase
MDKSQVVVFEKPNVPLEVREFDIPELEEGCILVKTLVSGVCGTDAHCWRGQVQMPVPVILGHESVGMIEKIAPDRKTDSVGEPVKEGDRIFWVAGHPCQQCYSCVALKDTTGCTNRRSYGWSYSCADYPYLTGGYSEYVFLTARSYFFRIPDSVPTDAAIAFGCGFPTAVKGFEVIQGVQPGESVVIQGAGPVGLSSLVMAKLGGASPIVVIGAPSSRLEMARKLGADETIDIAAMPEPEARVSKVRELLGGEADLVIEATGFPEAVSEGLDMCKTGGRYLVMGVFSDLGPVPINPSFIVRKNLRLYGSVFWEAKHLYQVLQLLARYNDQFSLQDAVTHRYGLEQSTSALEDVEALKCVKAVIQPGFQAS